MTVTKRTDEPIKFEWDYNQAQENLLDNFRLEKADGLGGWDVIAGIDKTLREFNTTAFPGEFRVLSVKGSLTAEAADHVVVVIDDTPPAPLNFRAS